jgi:hypothetical protein
MDPGLRRDDIWIEIFPAALTHPRRITVIPAKTLGAA